MSQLLINDYLKQLDLIKKLSGSNRETIIREAFKDLLKAWGHQHNLVFLAEYPLKTATKTNITVDGVLLHELRMALGYWEAKDEKDDLEAEIQKKFNKGYPQDNIIFSDDVTAGTGTFICELLEHFRGSPQKLKQKYLNELHANEVAILPYYVANLNIESTYAVITGRVD